MRTLGLGPPLLALLLAVPFSGCVADEPAPPRSPYVGQEARQVKGLSAEDVDGLLRGAGLGYAKSAELNHYPGPLHALELADHLALTDAQRATATRLRAEMLAVAVPLGERLLALEAGLEEMFREGAIDEGALRAQLEAIGATEASLREAHLLAHVRLRAVLSDDQVTRYDAMRGYAGGGGHEGHEGHDAAHG